MTANELTYFTVEGHWYDVEAPDPSGSTNALQFLVVSAFVTFTPRLKPGTVVYIPNLDLDGGTTSANTALAIAPVTARILQGELQTIDRTRRGRTAVAGKRRACVSFTHSARRC